MSATSIMINVGATTASAIRELDKVNASLDGQTKSVDGWKGKLSKAGPAIAAAFAVAGAAAAAVAKEFFDMGMEAIEDANSVERLNETLGKIPGTTQKAIDANGAWVDSMQIATLYADTSLRQSVADLALATGDLTKAQELTALAADLATTKNISLEAATKVLTRGVGGSTKKLEDWGLVVDENKDGVIDLEEVTRGLTKTVGGAAEAAANRRPWERIKVIYDEIREALGTWLIPLMEELGNWFKNKQNQQRIQDFIDKIAELSRQFGVKAVKAIQDFYAWLNSAEGKRSIANLKSALDGAVRALQSLAVWLEENDAIFRVLGASIKWISNWIKIVTAYWSTLIGVLKNVWNWLSNVASKIANIRAPSWLSSLNPFSLSVNATKGYGSSINAMSAGASTRSTVTYKVYVTGTGNPYSDAKIIKRALEHEDKTQGRVPGQRLATAW